MKVFGNGNSSGNGASKAPKPKKTKKTLTKKQKVQRAVIAVAVVLALVVTGAALWNTIVSPPNPANKPNNATINDAQNGDAPDAANLGDRVADYFTFLVGAVDEDETRTDALMVCGFDTKTQKINILNIPRDTMSDVARKGAAKKINAAYGTKKGIEQTKAEVQKVIGFAPDYYIIVNFKGIADIVDAIGGVDYEVPFRMYYKDPSQNLNIDFEPGMTHMNGQQVVEFLRWRKNNGGVKTGDPHYTGSDEERITKQQEFLKYLASQVLQPSNLVNINKITDAVFKNVKTDLTAGNMLWMGMKAMGTTGENIKMHTLPGDFAYSYAGTSWYGSFFFPDEEKTLALVNEYFNPYINKLTNLDVVSGPDKASGDDSDSGSSSGSSSSKKHKSPTTDSENNDTTDKTTTEKETQNTDTATKHESATTNPETKPATGGSGTGTETKPSTGDSGATTEQPATPPTGDSTGGSSSGGSPESSGTTAPATPPAATADPEA